MRLSSLQPKIHVLSMSSYFMDPASSDCIRDRRRQWNFVKSPLCKVSLSSIELCRWLLPVPLRAMRRIVSEPSPLFFFFFFPANSQKGIHRQNPLKVSVPSKVHSTLVAKDRKRAVCCSPAKRLRQTNQRFVRSLCGTKICSPSNKYRNGRSQRNRRQAGPKQVWNVTKDCGKFLGHSIDRDGL